MATKRAGTIGKISVILGSLLYLYVAFRWLYGYLAGANAPILLMGPGGVWIPVAAALAVISSLMLFVLSLVDFAGRRNERVDRNIVRATYWGGLALLALAAGSADLWIMLLGFMLAFVGHGWDSWM